MSDYKGSKRRRGRISASIFGTVLWKRERPTASGAAGTTIGVVINDIVRGEQVSTMYILRMYGRDAELYYSLVNVGDRVFASGALTARIYTNKNNEPALDLSIIVSGSPSLFEIVYKDRTGAPVKSRIEDPKDPFVSRSRPSESEDDGGEVEWDF